MNNLVQLYQTAMVTPAPKTGTETVRAIDPQVHIHTVGGSTELLHNGFNPLPAMVQLNEAVSTTATVGSVALAAHECGHIAFAKTTFYRFTIIAGLLSFIFQLSGIYLLCFTQHVTVGVISLALMSLYSLLNLVTEAKASDIGLALCIRHDLLEPEQFPMAQGLLRECLHSYRVYLWKQVAWSIAWIVLCLTFKAWVGYVLLPVLIGAQIFAVVSATIMNAKSGAFQTKSGACPWDPDWEDMNVYQKIGMVTDVLFHIGIMGFFMWFILLCFLESLKWAMGCY